MNYGKPIQRARHRRTAWACVLGLAAGTAGCASFRSLNRADVERAAEVSAGLLEPGEWSATVPPAAQAQPLPDDLAAYIAVASERNAAVRAAYDRWRAALERVPQVTALPDPMLRLENIDPRITGPGDEMMLQTMVEQMVPWPGKLDAKGAMALAAARAAERRFQAERLKLAGDVSQAYYRYAYLAAAARITEENVALLRQVEEVALAMLRAGKVPQQNVLAVQVEVGRMENELRTLRDEERPAAAQLNALLNRPADAPLARPGPLPLPGDPLDTTAVVRRFRTRNPELRMQDEMIAEADAQITMARLEYWPDVSLGLMWMTDETPLTRSDGATDQVVGTLQMNLPIWRRKLRAGVREAESRRSAAVAERREFENRLAAQLEQALFEVRDADRRARLYTDDLIPRAEQAWKTAQAGYAAGTVEFQNLIDSERMLLEFRLMRERALADYGRRLAEVRMLAPEGDIK